MHTGYPILVYIPCKDFTQQNEQDLWLTYEPSRLRGQTAESGYPLHELAPLQTILDPILRQNIQNWVMGNAMVKISKVAFAIRLVCGLSPEFWFASGVSPPPELTAHPSSEAPHRRARSS